MWLGAVCLTGVPYTETYYAEVLESYRDEETGKSKHRHVMNVGRIKDGEIPWPTARLRFLEEAERRLREDKRLADEDVTGVLKKLEKKVPRPPSDLDSIHAEMVNTFTKQARRAFERMVADDWLLKPSDRLWVVWVGGGDTSPWPAGLHMGKSAPAGPTWRGRSWAFSIPVSELAALRG